MFVYLLTPEHVQKLQKQCLLQVQEVDILQVTHEPEQLQHDLIIITVQVIQHSQVQ